MPWVILFFFVLAALPAIQDTGFPQKLADLLTRPLERVLTACARILQPTFESLKSWLKKAAVPEPEQVLSGCLLLGVGVAACICNYQQMAWALALLLPVETGARLIAFVLVAMAAAIGFMLHTSGSRATKAFAWALFLALMCMEGRIAYQRTVETERLEQQDRAIQAAGVQGAGQLTIDAADVADHPQPIANGTQDKAFDPGPGVSNLSQTGLQAGLLAVLLAAAVAGCFWRGYTQGGGAVARGVALPALAVIGLPLGLLTVVNESRWADKLNPVLAGIFMGFAKAAARTAQAVRDVAAYFSTASRHSRKLRKIQRQVELEAMEAFRQLEAEARLRIDEAGLDLLVQRNREIIETLAREYEGFPVGVLREVLENLRPAVVATVTPRASRAITDSVSDVVERLCVNGAVVRHQAGPEVSKEVIQ